MCQPLTRGLVFLFIGLQCPLKICHNLWKAPYRRISPLIPALNCIEIQTQFCSVLKPAVGRIAAANASVTQFILNGQSREHINKEHEINMMPEYLALTRLCEKPILEGWPRMKLLQLLVRSVALRHKRSPPLIAVEQFSWNEPIPPQAENNVDETKICQKCGERC